MTTHEWKRGDKFKINPDFSMEHDGDDETTGVTEEMVAQKDKEQTVQLVTTALGCPPGIQWLLDMNYHMWRTDWVTPMIEESND